MGPLWITSLFPPWRIKYDVVDVLSVCLSVCNVDILWTNGRLFQLLQCWALIYRHGSAYGGQLLANMNMSSSVRPSVVCLSVTFMHPTQRIEIFGNVSTPFNTFVIWRHTDEILRRSSQGNPSGGGGGVKPKRGSQI